MTYEQAINVYIHRYTMEHVPRWADKPAPNGKFYAPQFASDREWFEHTLFPPHHPLGRKETSCYTSGQTWPLGQWLDTRFQR